MIPMIALATTLAAAEVVASAIANSDTVSALVAAANRLLSNLERSRAIDARCLRAAIESAFGGSDAQGCGAWKNAYEACEVAHVLFLCKFGPAMLTRSGSRATLLAILAKVSALLLSHTRRSEKSQEPQQYSTPIALGLIASVAAAATPTDMVLETFDVVLAAADDAAGAVSFRRGWFLGDGTGAGKGRQVAGVTLDNWLKGCRRALWISKSDKADRGRAARLVGARPGAVAHPAAVPLQGGHADLAQRRHPFYHLCHATARRARRKASRRRQIVDWLGRDFDGVIVFDESQAMQNAAGEKSARGEKGSSQHGRAGLRTNLAGSAILGAVLERHPLASVTERMKV